MQEFKVHDKVKVVGGNNEFGQPPMLAKTGKISMLGSEYLVKGEKTKEIYVEINGQLHVFNDYHLEKIKLSPHKQWCLEDQFNGDMTCRCR